MSVVKLTPDTIFEEELMKSIENPQKLHVPDVNSSNEKKVGLKILKQCDTWLNKRVWSENTEHLKEFLFFKLLKLFTI